MESWQTAKKLRGPAPARGRGLHLPGYLLQRIANARYFKATVWEITKGRFRQSTSSLGGPAGLFGDNAHIAELFVPPLEQILGFAAFKIAQGLGDVLLDRVGGRVGITVGARPEARK